VGNCSTLWSFTSFLSSWK